MIVSFTAELGVGYLKVKDGKSALTREIVPGKLRADYNVVGVLLGVEFLASVGPVEVAEYVMAAALGAAAQADGPPATIDELAAKLRSLPVAVDPDDDAADEPDADATPLSVPDDEYSPGELADPTLRIIRDARNGGMYGYVPGTLTPDTDAQEQE